MEISISSKKNQFVIRYTVCIRINNFHKIINHNLSYLQAEALIHYYLLRSNNLVVRVKYDKNSKDFYEKCVVPKLDDIIT
jgi:hypothetical protein